MADFHPRDITALRRNHFHSGVTLDEPIAARPSMAQFEADTLHPALEGLIAVRDRRNAKAKSDFLFKQQKKNARQAGREARQQREILQQLPDAMSALDEALAIEDPTTRAVAMSKVTRDYSTLAAANPAFRLSVSAANDELAAKEAADAKVRAAEDKRIDSFIKAGDFEGARSVMGEVGSTDARITRIADAESISGTLAERKARLEAQEESKEAAKRAKSTQERFMVDRARETVEHFEDMEKVVPEMKLGQSLEDFDATPAYTEDDKSAMVTTLKSAGVPESTITLLESDPDALYDMALSIVRKAEEGLIFGTKQSSVTNDVADAM